MRNPGWRKERGTQVGASLNKPPVSDSSASTIDRVLVFTVLSLSTVLMLIMCQVRLKVSRNLSNAGSGGKCSVKPHPIRHSFPTDQFTCFSARQLRASRSFVKIYALIGLSSVLFLSGCYPQGSVPQGVQVYFSPHGGATEAVVEMLQHATNSILLQAYSFTSAPIARALVDAQKRGLSVRVILDKSQRTEKYSESDFLIHEGIATLIDPQHAIAHNKDMVLHAYLVLTGSFIFTK